MITDLVPELSKADVPDCRACRISALQSFDPRSCISAERSFERRKSVWKSAEVDAPAASPERRREEERRPARFFGVR
jgi:hypothetical protein